MAELTTFGYVPGNSVIHSFDTRFKLISLIVLSFSILRTGLIDLLFLTFLLILIFTLVRISLRGFIKTLKPFLVLVFFVFVSRYFTAERTESFVFFHTTLSLSGIKDGVLVSSRLLQIFTLSFLFISTTRTTELKTAAGHLLKPVPFIPEKKAALMISLMIRFLPEIMYAAQNTLTAQKSRCMENCKNPLRRVKHTAIPIMGGVLKKADKLAISMESRCFTEDHKIKEMKSSARDWFYLGVILLLSLAITLL